MRRAPAYFPILALLLALGAVACSPNTATTDAPEILELSQGTFTGGDFPLQVEWREEPRVLDLRTREKLDAVVGGAKSEMDVFKRLMAWARSQFEPGIPDPYPLSNGSSILSDIRSGKTGGFCGQYAYVLGDALKSFGYFAIRYVELESESGAGHFAVEAWCNDLGRWILLDPLHAAIYVRDGVPLSAAELHDDLLSGRASSLHINRIPLKLAALAGRSAPAGAPHAALPKASEPTDAELLSVFYNVAVSTRNDFARLDQPLSIAQREAIFLRYGDPRVAPFRHMNFALASVRRDDLLTPMNQVAIEVRPEPSRDVIHLAFSTHGTCPHFARYRVRIGDGAWKDSGPLLGWSLAPGENRLEVRTVNAFEVLGPVFRLRVKV